MKFQKRGREQQIQDENKGENNGLNL